MGNLGNAYDSLGQHQRAIEYYQQSLEIQRDIGYRNGKASSLCNLGSTYGSLGQFQRAIEFFQQSLEIQRDIGDRNGEAVSLYNSGHAHAKLDNHGQALLNFQQAKAIYEDLKLDHKVEECDEAIRNCTQIIAAERRTPPTIGKAPAQESLIDWYERERQANQPKTYTRAQRRAMNQQFYLWFAVGLAIVFLLWWLKR
ncbi:tetratricopeptide repeat protein [Alkalinema sp. FACHB-956]|uniref:tetratricopeptide repeat protein n=1 Tax=Alkalinema sp. FACHB-956 TaxID=2692768 RepID=UPI00321F9654